MVMLMPYFLKNEEWYKYKNEDERIDEDGFYFPYALSEKGKSIPEVVKSYKEYYKERKEHEFKTRVKLLEY